MNRRELLVSAASTMLPLPAAAWAKGSATIPLIVCFVAGAKVSKYETSFQQGMSDLGYIAGKDYTYISRYGDARFERLPDIAKEVVALQPNIVLADAVQEAGLVRKLTDEIPVVFVGGSESIVTPLIVDYSHPHENMTGLLHNVNGDITKRAQILHDMFPNKRRIGLLFHDDALAAHREDVNRQFLLDAANRLGVELTQFGMAGPENGGAAFSELLTEGVDAVMVTSDGIFTVSERQLAGLAVGAKLPIIGSYREQAEAGFLITYGTDWNANYRRGAYFVDRILKGARPGDLPVEFPSKFELIINLNTAKAIEVKVPESSLALADEVIE